MRFLTILAIPLLITSTAVKAFDVTLLANNKESLTRQIKKSEFESSFKWMDQIGFHPDEIKAEAISILKKSIEQIEGKKAQCDLRLSTLLYEGAKKKDLVRDSKDYLNLLVFMRNYQAIDDILYKILKDSHLLSLEFVKRANDKIPMKPFFLNSKKHKDIDLKKLYADFRIWPDEQNICSISTYSQIVQPLKWKNRRDRSNQIQKLNIRAIENNLISLETFNKLEVFREHEVSDWSTDLKEYLDVISNAKDKLAKEREVTSENDFSSTYTSRKEGLTQRGRLYKTFDSTQIIMLAQLLEKTAKRMDARHVSLSFQFTEDNKDDLDIYVLSPMEQYRVSIKLLRKEMAETMRSETFKGTNINFEDIIAASFETGLIKSEELDYVPRFEEFWTAKPAPKWKAYANFAFSLAGSATFYLPPPWNVIGAIGLVLTQTKVMNKDNQPDSEDNWNSIL